MVTASHNPPEYNGYKVYWDDGCQITAPKDTQIINEVKAVTDFNDVKTIDEEEARVRGLYNIIGYDMDDAFIAALKKRALTEISLSRLLMILRLYTLHSMVQVMFL